MAWWRPVQNSLYDPLMTLMTTPGGQINIKMSSYQYRKSHCGDKTFVRSSYLHHGISYTGKMTSLYWFGPQVSSSMSSMGHTMNFGLVVTKPLLVFSLTIFLTEIMLKKSKRILKYIQIILCLSPQTKLIIAIWLLLCLSLLKWISFNDHYSMIPN